MQVITKTGFSSYAAEPDVLQNEEMKPNRTINPLVVAAWSLWMIGAFGFYTIGGRLWIQLDGIVISSRDFPPNRGPRYATEYVLRGPDGRESFYAAGPTDSSLPRSMPVGTSLKKERWHLDYERDGQRVNDFGVFFYGIVLLVGFAGLGWSIFMWRRRNQ